MFNPGSEEHYRLLWTAMADKKHVPVIKPVFLPEFSGWLGECHKCKLMAFSGEKLHFGVRFFGSAIDHDCPITKEN